MGKIIAVASGKGGTGKTTFTANTALALAAMGQRVLCLDCDITLRNLDLALGLSDRALMDFSDVMEGRCTLDEAAVPHKKYPSLFLLTAPMADRPLTLSVTGIQNLARAIREKFDWCLIDAPAGLGQGFQMAACMADQVIVITTTDVSAMRDAHRDGASGGGTGVPEGAAGAAHHHRRRHRRGGSAAAGRGAGGSGRALLPESGTGAAGAELLRRPRL